MSATKGIHVHRFGVALLMLALLGCGGGSDDATKDAGVGDAMLVDGRIVIDGRVIDGSLNRPDATSSGRSCANHHECDQKEFCHRGTCRLDAEAVYHCGKAGCPPGHWCVEADGKRDRCAEDPNYACENACDCGPAHCCIDDDGNPNTHKRCIKDDGDPWIGTGDPAAPSMCEGEPTYCSTAPECPVAEAEWHDKRPGEFLAWSSDRGTIERCNIKGCFGWSCNCAPGQSCIDTTAPGVPSGSTCGILSGGTCVSHALAESVYAWKPSDLLDCCSESTPEGARCEVGWLHHGNRFAFQRVVAQSASDCACGDSRCCPEEMKSCPNDCAPEVCDKLGNCSPNPCNSNGVCELSETFLSCWEDCAETCGNGRCEEVPETCPHDCLERDGDGWCTAAEADASQEYPVDCATRCPDHLGYIQRSGICGDGKCNQQWTCQWGEAESCRTCPQDCGICEWLLSPDAPSAPLTHNLYGLWGSSPTDFYAVGGSGTIIRFDGNAWKPSFSGTTESLRAVAGNSSGLVVVVGSGGTILRQDGVGWTIMNSNTTEDLTGVWVSEENTAFAVGNRGIILYLDGVDWSALDSTTSEPLTDVWGVSPTDVFASGYAGTVLHYDGTRWSAMKPGKRDDYLSVWASSATDVYLGGTTPIHFDGNTWTGLDRSLHDLWGSAPNDVFGVGLQGQIEHFDGSNWVSLQSRGPSLYAVWGFSSTNVFAVGASGTIMHFDGDQWSLMNERAAAYDDVWMDTENTAFLVEALRGDIWRLEVQDPPRLFSDDITRIHAIWGTSTSNIFGVGQSSRIVHFNGSLWQEMEANSAASLNDVWGDAPSNVYAVGHGGTVLHFNGIEWTLMQTPTTENLRSLGTTATGELCAVGTSGTIICLENNAWVADPLGQSDSLSAITGSKTGETFVITSRGKVFSRTESRWLEQLGAGLYKTMPSYGTSNFDFSDGHRGRLFAAGYHSSNTTPLHAGLIAELKSGAWVPAKADFRQVGHRDCPRFRSIDTLGDAAGIAVGSEGVIARYSPQTSTH